VSRDIGHPLDLIVSDVGGLRALGIDRDPADERVVQTGQAAVDHTRRPALR
jgi:hypothetical protein